MKTNPKDSEVQYNDRYFHSHENPTDKHVLRLVF